MSHYRITVVEVLSTTYEVWADNEVAAKTIAEMSPSIDHPARHETDQDFHPPRSINIDVVDRKFEA